MRRIYTTAYRLLQPTSTAATVANFYSRLRIYIYIYIYVYIYIYIDIYVYIYIYNFYSRLILQGRLRYDYYDMTQCDILCYPVSLQSFHDNGCSVDCELWFPASIHRVMQPKSECLQTPPSPHKTTLRPMTKTCVMK